jgi:large subunit ribosomal protein L6e
LPYAHQVHPDKITALALCFVTELNKMKTPSLRIPKIYQTLRILHRDTKKRSKNQKRIPKLRESITPGTILILLKGVHQGCRVIFLKQLSSGLLLVTGPNELNGVPLHRVNQCYVITTLTKIQLNLDNLVNECDDDMFSVSKTRKKNKFIEDIQMEVEDVNKDKRMLIQEKIDQEIILTVTKDPMLKGYLKDKFTLRRGDAPHKLIF